MTFLGLIFMRFHSFVEWKHSKTFKIESYSETEFCEFRQLFEIRLEMSMLINLSTTINSHKACLFVKFSETWIWIHKFNFIEELLFWRKFGIYYDRFHIYLCNQIFRNCSMIYDLIKCNEENIPNKRNPNAFVHFLSIHFLEA